MNRSIYIVLGDEGMHTIPQALRDIHYALKEIARLIQLEGYESQFHEWSGPLHHAANLVEDVIHDRG